MSLARGQEDFEAHLLVLEVVADPEEEGHRHAIRGAAAETVHQDALHLAAGILGTRLVEARARMRHRHDALVDSGGR